jgi:Na+-driven multidrug efflux pump
VFLILGFLMGFTQGAAIITSQRFGRGDSEGVRRSFAASLILGLMFTALLMLVSLLTAKPLLVLLGTPEEIFDGALGYIIVIYWGIPAAMLFNLFPIPCVRSGTAGRHYYFW